MNEFTELPDLLAPGLKAIICGLNPGLQAAASGHHFVGRQNRFWTVAHRAGLTPVLLDGYSDHRFLEFGFGLTAVVARPTASAAEVSKSEYAFAGAELARKIETYRPQAVAFLGKAAYGAIHGQSKIAWGQQPEAFAGAIAWVLPNPSGLNRGFSTDDLVDHYSRFRQTL